MFNGKLDIPKIEPINVKQYEFKQSPYPQADKLPFRSIIVSASQGGKGILIQNLVLKIYRGCFERIYIVSPTAHIDEAYNQELLVLHPQITPSPGVKIKQKSPCLICYGVRAHDIPVLIGLFPSIQAPES